MEVAKAQKLIDIARCRGITMSEILQYDLFTNSSLFEGQSPSKPDKYKIVTKLENILQIKNGFENLYDTNNVLVVDFVSVMPFINERFLKFSGAPCCRVELYWRYLMNSMNAILCCVDSYIAGSFKKCERRSTCEPLHFDSLTPSTKVTSLHGHQYHSQWFCSL